LQRTLKRLPQILFSGIVNLRRADNRELVLR